MATNTANRPDTSLTLDDLVLRVAEAFGLADYSGDKAAVPTSPHDYDLCLRAVNDGIARIYRANPRWNFLRQTVRFPMSTDGTGPWNIESDPARYRMPWFVSTPPEESAICLTGSTSTQFTVPVVALAYVRNARAAAASDSGTPQIAAVDRSQVASLGSRPQWEMVVYPDPDYAYVVEATFRCFAPRMVEACERHVMGAEHDQTAIAAAQYAMSLTDNKDPSLREHYRAEFEKAVAESIALDRMHAPRTIPRIHDPSVQGDDFVYDFGERNISTVTNGVSSSA